MSYQYDIIGTIQQLYQRIETQQHKIDELEKTLEALQNEIAAIKKQNSGKIERIEYKFDQLKVERLEGTLNIGITPTGGIQPSSIEDFTIDQNTIDVRSSNQQQSDLLFENIKREINQYLHNECFKGMENYERQYNYQLDGPYRKFIIEDVRKQIDSRIHYYLKGLNINENNEQALKEMETTIINKVIYDINQTIEQFIKHLPQKGV